MVHMPKDNLAIPIESISQVLALKIELLLIVTILSLKHRDQSQCFRKQLDLVHKHLSPSLLQAIF